MGYSFKLIYIRDLASSFNPFFSFLVVNNLVIGVESVEFHFIFNFFFFVYI